MVTAAVGTCYYALMNHHISDTSTLALRVAHRGYVMESGAIALEDTAQNLLKSEKVKAAYLGL